MIPSWLHGTVDWAVAALFGGAATSSSLSPPVRGTLAAAGAFHASYSAVTDYELGVRPLLTMRQHLLLDVLGGTALICAGIKMDRQPAVQRALLVAAGMSELAIVALSDTRCRVRFESADPTYPPLDVPRRVADDVFIVDSAMPGVMGKLLPVRMTVIRLPNGDLLLHSPTRFSENLRNDLQRIGRIAHLIAPNIAHWTFLQAWQLACPDAMTWAAPGLRQRSQVRKSGVHLDFHLRERPPASWRDVITTVTVPGGGQFHEVALFHKPSRTLLLTDLVLNLEPGKVPMPMRPLLRLFGSMAPDGMPPLYLRAIIKLRRRDAAAAALRLLDLQPERVIFSHGRWFQSDGTAALRHSLRWLLP